MLCERWIPRTNWFHITLTQLSKSKHENTEEQQKHEARFVGFLFALSFYFVLS